MAVKVEIEFPVVTKTTPARGEGKIIIGTSSLSVEIEELAPQSVPVTARVQCDHLQEQFRVDRAGQFFWQIGGRRGMEKAFAASIFSAYFRQPSTIYPSDVERYFGRPDRAGLKAVFNKRGFGKPRRVADRKSGSFDQALVDQQIAAKAEQLRDYAVIDNSLYLRTEEPLMRVSKFGQLYFHHGDPWTTLAPNQCFSLRELPKALDLARRISEKEPERTAVVELIDPERHSPDFRDQRIALVNRYVLDLAKEYISESRTEEIGTMLLACAREGDLMEKLLAAAQQVGQGSITPSVLAAAESMLYRDPSSPWSAIIDNVGSARAVMDFLREEWDERPIDIGHSIVASLGSARKAAPS